MRFFYSSWLAPPVGLDWGSRWGKLVHLRRVGKTFALSRVARFCWPTDERGGKGTLLKAVWAHLGLGKKDVFLALGGNTFFASSPETFGLEHSVLQLQKPGGLLSVRPAEYSAGTVLRDKNGNSRHLRISASREQVEEARRQIQQAGLNVRVVDNKALALCNLYAFAYADQRARPVYLLHLGRTHCLLLFYQAGIPVWLERLELTGELLAGFLAQPPPGEYQTALPLSGSTAGNNSPHGLENEIEKILVVLRARQHADTMYLSGGSALLPSLLAALRARLPLDVRILNCWRGLRIDPAFFDLSYLEAAAPQFAVACGMALRAATKPGAGEQA